MPPHFLSQAYQKSVEGTQHAALSRLLEAYDIGIRAGIERNTDQALHVIALLEATLDPTASLELTLSLRAIYEDCRQYVEDGNWSQFCESFERLKGLWSAYGKLHLDPQTENCPVATQE